tara:strand:- start:454 stop:1389 length:936 start_codon:yes stop_codon:yes gene_type:complete
MNDKTIERSKLTTLLSIACSFLLLALPLSANAAVTPGTVSVDVTKSQTTIDYSAVDAYHSAQPSQVKFAAVDGEQLVLSDKPIIITPVNIYKPKTLADLGLRFNPTNAAAGNNISPIETYMLVDNSVSAMPAIPQVVVAEIAQTAPTAEAAPTAEVTQVAPTAAATQPVVAANTTQATNVVKSSAAITSSSSLMTMLASATLFVLCLLFISLSRRSAPAVKSSLYAGYEDESDKMVGKGELFDFSGKVLKGNITPIDTNYLNMLWHVGKFSKEGSMNTYFYMAFYKHPQNAYATTLKENEKSKDKERDTTA